MLINFNNALTQAAYDALSPKDQGTLYFTTDSRRLYKGSELYCDSVTVLTSLPANGRENHVYIINDGISVLSYIWDGSAFKQIGQAQLDKVLTDVDFDPSTTVFTYKYADDTTKEINLALASVIQGVAYNNATKILTFTLSSGATTDISLTDLVDVYNGGTTDSATVTVNAQGQITVDIKVSSDADNIFEIRSDGAYVPKTDISDKMDLATGAVVGNISTFDANGQVVDSGKGITNSVRKTGATDDLIPTEFAVNAAIEAALTWQ